MKKVKYTGHKLGGISVHLPIGCKSRSAFKSVIHFNPIAELEEKDAEELIKLDANFALVEEVEAEEKPKKRKSSKAEVEIGQ